MISMTTTMSKFNYIWITFYLGGALGAMFYNAYQHNFQLLALWILVTTQSLALGGALQRLENKDD